MVLRWRRINGRNVQVNVDEDKIKEKLKQDSINSESYKKQLLSNTEKKLTHQEMNDYRAHPDRIKERQQQDEDRRRERDQHQNSLGFGSGSAGRADLYMSQGLSEDDAILEAFHDNNIDTSEIRRQMAKPEHERRI